jgi:hypothetical protein
LVRTDLVPALDDVYSLASKYAVGLAGSFEIQVQNRLVILLPGSILGTVISVIAFKVLVVDMGGSSGSVHVWRVEDDAVDGGVLIWEAPAINSILQICGEEPIGAFGNPLPKHALAVSDVGDRTSRRHVEGNHLRENIFVGTLVGRENELIGRDAGRRLATTLPKQFRPPRTTWACVRICKEQKLWSHVLVSRRCMKSIFMHTIDSNGSGDEKEPRKFYHKLS